ncbi:hypothetical protein AAGW05_03165 [Arthrobacter sp. LAPM80]|uniref:hypothetical protein n=1 Tax=Arthrobacter sp. LAPM80 TaxID=3141788 RepID=UPI00398B95A5
MATVIPGLISAAAASGDMRFSNIPAWRIRSCTVVLFQNFPVSSGNVIQTTIDGDAAYTQPDFPSMTVFKIKYDAGTGLAARSAPSRTAGHAHGGNRCNELKLPGQY